MPRFGRKRDEGPVAPTVVTGTLGDPGDDDRLEVTFRIIDDEVRLTAGEREIGSWPLEDVSMTSGGSTLWYFEAEGDRLPFVPNRPAALEASALVDSPDTGSRRARLRRRRSRVPPARPEPPAAEQRRTEHPPDAPPPDDRPDPAVEVGEGVDEEQVPRPRSRRRLTNPVTRPGSRSTADGGPSREGLWLRSVDTARRRGWFGLDRLPVDESNRDGPHQHTWDHPAAASSGPAQHVCTICGAVRR